MSEINKDMAARFVADVPENNRFFVEDGHIYKNLEEFEEGLNKISNESFKFHVNAQKNDFSNWIYDIIGDTELAETIRKCKDKKTILKRLRSRINYLKSIKK